MESKLNCSLGFRNQVFDALLFFGPAFEGHWRSHVVWYCLHCVESYPLRFQLDFANQTRAFGKMYPHVDDGA